jgi:hypothetical protein
MSILSHALLLMSLRKVIAGGTDMPFKDYAIVLTQYFAASCPAEADTGAIADPL